MPLYLKERLNHEYWPWWLIYIPLLPLILKTAMKLRSAVFFSVANPSIDMGGFFGERKSDIYALLPKSSYPTTILIEPSTSIDGVLKLLNEVSIPFPLIIKPDVGERGDGVQIVKTSAELTALIGKGFTQTMLLQELILWQGEYGLMVSKDPDTGAAKLLSITGKRFLSVIGDGVSSVVELLSQTYRGQKQVSRLLGTKLELLMSVPQQGETIVVEPIGNHIRGTIFFDASHLITPKLQAAVQHLMDQTTGVYYGRFDVRAMGDAGLMDGQFTIIELNGVTSEPAHIYDPSYSIWRAWAEMYRHHSLLPEISNKLIKLGHKPVTLLELIVRAEQHFGIKLTKSKWLVRMLTGDKSTGVQGNLVQGAA